jgi:hypothetical protein
VAVKSSQHHPESDTIEVTRPFPLGRGETESSDSSLFRPFLDLLSVESLRSGRPVGSVNYVFFTESPPPEGILGLLLWKAMWWRRDYVLGSLCRTVAGRTLFFPGVTQRTMSQWSARLDAGRQTPEHGTLGLVDHITLENDLRSGHVTSKTGPPTKAYPFVFRTIRTGDLVYWFGFCFRPRVLEVTPAKVTWKVSVPSSDSLRRANDLKQAIDGAIFHGPSMSCWVTKLHQTRFLLFTSPFAPMSAAPAECIGSR